MEHAQNRNFSLSQSALGAGSKGFTTRLPFRRRLFGRRTLALFPAICLSLSLDQAWADNWVGSGTAGVPVRTTTTTTKVGIGITGTGNVANMLDVEGSAVIGATYSGTNAAPANGLLVQGNVGIGNTSPGAYRLSVTGATRLGNNATVGRSGTATTDKDEYGFNIGFTSTSNSYTRLAADYAASIRMGGSGGLEFRTAPTSTAGSALTLTTRMFLGENGRLGVGTLAPSARFEISGAGAADGAIRASQGYFEVDGVNANASVNGGTNNFRLGFPASGRLGFNLQGTERFTLLTNGFVGVNTTGIPGGLPRTSLEVNGNGVEGGAVRISNGYFEADGVNTSAVAAGGTNNLRIGWAATGRVAYNLQGNEVMSMKPTGQVGIGTTNPLAGLHVVRMNSGMTTDGLILENPTSNGFGSALSFYGRPDAIQQTSVENARIVGEGHSARLKFSTRNGSNALEQQVTIGPDFTTIHNRTSVEGKTPGQEAFVVDQGQNWVIAQFRRNGQPKVTIEENGDITGTGKISVASVRTQTWTVAPDYVFEKDYKLAKLEDVEAFVKKNKHLPEVPSAKEFKEKGMDLAEMNFTLLKKVEELTLHAINQKKLARAQEMRSMALEKEIKNLKRDLASMAKQGK